MFISVNKCYKQGVGIHLFLLDIKQFKPKSGLMKSCHYRATQRLHFNYHDHITLGGSSVVKIFLSLNQVLGYVKVFWRLDHDGIEELLHGVSVPFVYCQGFPTDSSSSSSNFMMGSAP